MLRSYSYRNFFHKRIVGYLHSVHHWVNKARPEGTILSNQIVVHDAVSSSCDSQPFEVSNDVGATRTLIMMCNIKICGTNRKESIGIGTTHTEEFSGEDRKFL